ncbi:MAG: riboflavin synthase [Gammaproteobacteria bacterium]
MFTGIVATVGRIEKLHRVGDAMRLRIHAGNLDLTDVALGDSIAVSGPCLTVVALEPGRFEVDVSSETLARTTLDERLGGHLVSGHVDGIGRVLLRDTLDDYVRFSIGVPAALARYLAFKGSVCVDGVSLTVNAAHQDSFEILTIPHTLERTTLNALGAGAEVNIEVDLIARYIERLLTSGGHEGAGISLSSLVAAGFAGNDGR